ncbi:MAG: GNAT family N-acetyltransferase [Bifidobacterium crudilactis]|jgi:phosphinothricin acetyltransferase|nr:GNAT family N-acetyltransferase [Bifidobacterium crudilactis]MCI1890238.1 GNAT family N-acetyltransferase [Bifidobacterium crudilactis]
MGEAQAERDAFGDQRPLSGRHPSIRPVGAGLKSSEAGTSHEQALGLSEGYGVRPAEDEDLQAITDIYNQAVSSGGASADTAVQTVEQRAVWLHSHTPRNRYPVIVVQEAGTVAAFASISRFHPRPGYDAIVELSYYVGLGHRGHGLGTSLVKWGLQTARELGYASLNTVIFADNAGSMALMRRFDFIQYGLLPHAAEDSQGVRHDVAYWYHSLS